MIVSWFSAGCSSAVATKMATKVDKIITIRIDDQHPDTLRFENDCAKWFGKEIESLRSRYSSVDAACRGASYISGPRGAACTRLLKRQVRILWEQEQTDPLTYVWGIDYTERHRADRIIESMPNQTHIFPLIDNKISKDEAHRIIKASGIKRPAMYDLGYRNNNCVGCVKGGMGYWNKIRADFPDVFASRARLERLIGASCINGVYLDELNPISGRNDPAIEDECGILCEIMALK